MEEKCPKCGADAVNPKPAKYSPEDSYGKYRREAKKEELKEKVLNDEKVTAWIQEKQLKKFIVVPKKLVNIVI